MDLKWTRKKFENFKLSSIVGNRCSWLWLMTLVAGRRTSWPSFPIEKLTPFPTLKLSYLPTLIPTAQIFQKSHFFFASLNLFSKMATFFSRLKLRGRNINNSRWFTKIYWNSLIFVTFSKPVLGKYIFRPDFTLLKSQTMSIFDLIF